MYRWVYLGLPIPDGNCAASKRLGVLRRLFFVWDKIFCEKQRFRA
jgi:hypothetical protein